MPAAEAGSQNTPSSRATSRHASSSCSSASGTTQAVRAGEHGFDLDAVHGLDDADRGRERVGALLRLAEHEARQAARRTRRAYAHGVAAAAVREREHVRHAAELRRGSRRAAVLCPSIRSGLIELTLTYALLVGEAARLAMRVLERAVDLAHVGADGSRLRDLAAGDRAARRDHDRGQPRARGVGGGRRGGVPGRRADDAGRAALERARDGDRHAAVLEGPGRVRALPLQPQLDAEPLREPRRRQQRRVALAERDHTDRSVITGSAKGGRSTSGKAAISRSAAATVAVRRARGARARASPRRSRAAARAARRRPRARQVGCAACASTPGRSTTSRWT